MQQDITINKQLLQGEEKVQGFGAVVLLLMLCTLPLLLIGFISLVINNFIWWAVGSTISYLVSTFLPFAFKVALVLFTITLFYEPLIEIASMLKVIARGIIRRKEHTSTYLAIQRNLFPDECVGEMVAYRQRLTQEKTPHWKARLLVTLWFLEMLWGVHIEANWDNLWLPRSSTQKSDE